MKRKASVPKLNFPPAGTPVPVLSELPQKTQLISSPRPGCIPPPLSHHLYLECGSSIQCLVVWAFCHRLYLTRLHSYPSYNHTVMLQISFQWANVVALGYRVPVTLNPWLIHVWTCSCTTQPKQRKKKHTLLCQLSVGG